MSKAPVEPRGGVASGSGQKDYFQVTDELSRENSHFSLSEALLCVLEQVSCHNIHTPTHSHTLTFHKRTHMHARSTRPTRRKPYRKPYGSSRPHPPLITRRKLRMVAMISMLPLLPPDHGVLSLPLQPQVRAKNSSCIYSIFSTTHNLTDVYYTQTHVNVCVKRLESLNLEKAHFTSFWVGFSFFYCVCVCRLDGWVFVAKVGSEDQSAGVDENHGGRESTDSRINCSETATVHCYTVFWS